MIGVKKLSVFHPLILFLMAFSLQGSAQCPTVFDFFGEGSETPYWYSCSGNDFNFNLQSPDNWGEYTIDWGDGSPLQSGDNWNSPNSIPHLYTATVDTFNVVITEVNTGCIINGVVVMEEATSASIQIPVGGLTQACAPQDLEFINSSTNVSETTTFVWDFGDGSPNEVYDYTNWNQTVTHTYEVGTVDCETEVSLTAENYCNTIQGGESEATFDPIRIWDLDDAAITASATVLCYPDTTVTLENTTERNCLYQGNIAQRYEYWNFGDYWGLGYDSIVEWTPWPPTFPYTLHYPGIGTYHATLLDSNFCGVDTAHITIQIVEPPTAAIDISDDTVCVGELITLTQNATGYVETYEWNFDDGNGWLTTGSGDITYVFNTPGEYHIGSAIGISGSGSCSDTAWVDLVVQPGPDAQILMDNFEACNNLDVNFSQNNTDAVSWHWIFDVDPGTYDGPAPPTISYTDVGTYQVTLEVESANGCLNSTSEQVYVYPEPEADFEFENVCEGSEALFTDLSTFDTEDPILSWQWDFGDGETSSMQHPSHSYTSTGSYDVTLIVNTANCSSTITYTLDVEPSPTAIIDATNTSGCSPLTVSFESNSIGAAQYLWDFGDGSTSNQTNPNHTFFHFGEADTTISVMLTVTSSFGCSHTDSMDVLVSPGAIAAFNDNSLPPGCAPLEANFENTSLGAESYFWDFGDGFTSNLENPVHIYYNETGFIQSFDVTLIAYAPNGCNDTISSQVTVYPTPNFDFTVWPDSGCSPLVVTMPFVQGVNEFEWNFGDGEMSTEPTPTHIYENNTEDPIIFDVSLFGVSPFGCADSAYSQVIVNPQPVAQFLPDIDAGCSPLSVTFQNFSTQADTYLWEYGDDNDSNELAEFHSHVFENTTDSVVIYDVVLTAYSDDGCQDSFIVPIEVYPEVQAGYTYVPDACAPLDVQFENTSVTGSSWQWDLGNGILTTEENPSTFYTNNGTEVETFTASLTVISQYGCQGEYSQDFDIHPIPEASFTLSNTVGCDPAPITLTNTSELADNYVWYYGDGNNSNNGDVEHDHLFTGNSSEPINYEIMLIASSTFGCVDTAYNDFTLNPEVNAVFTSNNSGCSPLEVDFVNLSQGANAGYEWFFGDGDSTTLEEPSHIYFNNTPLDITFEVMLIGNSIYGCTDTTYQEIEVFHTPVSDIEITDTEGCYPLEVTFQNNSTGAIGYTWVYGTGQTGSTSDEEHVYTYYNNFSDEPVTYDVTLIAYSDMGCSSSSDTSVVVWPELEASFLADDADCSPFPVQFQNTSTGAENFEWQFGDGLNSFEENPEHTFYNSGVNDLDYNVLLIAESYYGCLDTAYFNVTVLATPIADFIASPASQMYPDATVELTNNSQAGDVTYTWDMDDNNELTGENPGSYTYNTWGEYIIELTLNNGSCADTAWQAIEILPPPPVALFDMDTIGCAPLTIFFHSQSTAAATYHWTFGDGGQAFVSDPIYTYYIPGTYDVTLTVTGYGTDQTDSYTIEQSVVVTPPAVASFTITPTEVSIPDQPLYTQNLSQNATSYEWGFGDGSVSYETNPVHYYTEEGIYDITLVAINEWGCNDTMTMPAAVNAQATGMIDFPNAFTPNLNTSSGGYYDPEAYNNDVFRPIHKGVTEYNLQIYNKWGELLFVSEDVLVGWDGYYKGSLAKEDVYVWKVKARFSDGTRLVQAGDVTLLIR